MEIVSWLVEELASLEEDVDQLASGGNSPLHLAAKRGNVAAVSTLLNAGAQVDLKSQSYNPRSDRAQPSGGLIGIVLLSRGECKHDGLDLPA